MTEFIISVLDWLNSIIMTLMPEVTLIPQLITNLDAVFNTVFDYLEKVNFIIPLVDIFLIITLDIALRTILAILFVANWVVRRIFDVIP